MENQFSKKVTYNGLSVKYALGPTSLRGNEIHTYHEMLYFMTDGNILYTKYGQRKIHAQTLVIIPKYTYHRTDIKDESKYRRIAMNFDDMFEPALFQEIMDDIHVFENITVTAGGQEFQFRRFVKSDISTVISENESNGLAMIAVGRISHQSSPGEG